MKTFPDMYGIRKSTNENILWGLHPSKTIHKKKKKKKSTKRGKPRDLVNVRTNVGFLS